MNISSPKVSVCIPTYNYGHFIAATIESVLAQTFTDFELIVVDNCSADATKDIVASYVAKDGRIRYFCNETNLGMVGNWNRCLEYAQGEYIKILCADDLLSPKCIEQSVEMLEGNPRISLVSCIRQLVDINLNPLTQTGYCDTALISSGSKVIEACFYTGNLIGEPTAVLFRKKAAVRGFDPRYLQLIDLEMWIHLLEKGWFGFIPEVLCSLRQHDAQGTKNSINTFSDIGDELLIRDTYFHTLPGNRYINMHRWRFHLALIIWNHQLYGVNKDAVKTQLKKYYPLPLFYVSLKVVKLRQRLEREFEKLLKYVSSEVS